MMETGELSNGIKYMVILELGSKKLLTHMRHLSSNNLEN